MNAEEQEQLAREIAEMEAAQRQTRKMLWFIWLSMAGMWLAFVSITLYYVLTWEHPDYFVLAIMLFFIWHMGMSLMQRPPWHLPK